MLLILGIAVALPATAMATTTWDGEAGDGDFANPINWDTNALPTNEFTTEEGRFDSATATFDETGLVQLDRARIKNANLDIVSGTLEFRNFTSSWGLGIFSTVAGTPSTVDISGTGTLLVEQLGVGYDMFTNLKAEGIINISGDGKLVIQPNIYDGGTPPAGYHTIRIAGDSIITLADNGELRVPATLDPTGTGQSIVTRTLVDYYLGGDFWDETAILPGDLGPYPDIANPLIISADPSKWLHTTVIGDEYVVTVVPEPTSLLLVCLGICSLALIRKR